jgi:FixJ family two-component response regulator
VSTRHLFLVQPDEAPYMTPRLVYSKPAQLEHDFAATAVRALPEPCDGDIFIVDDDPDTRRALSLAFINEGYDVSSFEDGSSFLAAVRETRPTCIILDVFMPRRSGLDILRELEAENCTAPIFILSGRGNIAAAVEAIRHGAFDFLEKRWPADTIASRVSETLKDMMRTWRNPGTSKIGRVPFVDTDLLTARERDVLGEIMEATSIKEAARNLGISPRTVEVHRAHILIKLGARNVAEVVRIVMEKGRGL